MFCITRQSLARQQDLEYLQYPNIFCSRTGWRFSVSNVATRIEPIAIITTLLYLTKIIIIFRRRGPYVCRTAGKLQSGILRINVLNWLHTSTHHACDVYRAIKSRQLVRFIALDASLVLVLAQCRKRQHTVQFDELRAFSTVYMEVVCVVSSAETESPLNLHSAVQCKCLSLCLR